MAAQLDGPKSKAEVEALLKQLDDAKDNIDASVQLVEGVLKKLHAGTRTLPEPQLQPLFDKEGVRLVGHYAFRDNAGPEHLPALRCLNNVLVRSTASRQTLAYEIGPQKIVASLKRYGPESELPLANILIFLSHNTSLNLNAAFESDDIAGTINASVARHAKSGELPTAEPTSTCSASLRLLSTLAARYEKQAHRFLDSVDPVLEMLSRCTVLSPPLQPPVSLIVNTLPVLPISDKESLSIEAVDKMIEVLTDCISFYGTQDKDSEFLTLLLTLHHISQSKAVAAKDRLKELLVPTDDDRTEALGMGQSLPHRLLKLSNSSMFPEIREVVMALYFELSDQDSSRFVYNVGFGNAAGYLSSKGIQLTQNDLQASGSAAGDDINPITGQRVDREPASDLPEMTDEEKEREAERLFVLFERLRATGVIDVENPAAQAMQMGSIEELSDGDDEDGDDNRGRR